MITRHGRAVKHLLRTKCQACREPLHDNLAPRAKVVQTVVCSTFTRGAKPATRRVADGERMNPSGKGGAFAPLPRRRRAPGRRAPRERSTQGLRPRAPVRMASSAPLFHPLTSYADAAGSCLHQRGGTPHPESGKGWGTPGLTNAGGAESS